jgi:hypothetical protein
MPLEKKPKLPSVLILQDFEPDDQLMMMWLDLYLNFHISFLIVVVSPNPAEHVEGTKKLFATTNSGRQITKVVQGARYYRTPEGQTMFDIDQEQDARIFKEFEDFFSSAEYNSIDIILATTCYALMHPWKPSYLKKTRIVYHMGGLGTPYVDKDTKETVTPLGFNWRVGTQYAHDFLEQIPSWKRIILEPSFYTPSIQKHFKISQPVSICPRHYKRAFETLGRVLERYKEKSTARLLLENNKRYLVPMLVKMEKAVKENPENEYEIRRYYPDKGQEHLYFGPADTLLAFAYIVREVERKEEYARVETKKIALPKTVIKDGVKSTMQCEYEVQSISFVDHDYFDILLGNAFARIGITLETNEFLAKKKVGREEKNPHNK